VSEGWKTNDNFKVNEKLIFSYGVRYESQYKSLSPWHVHYDSRAEVAYADLDRILCVINGQLFEKCGTVGGALSAAFERLNRRHGAESIAEQTTESWHFDIRFFKKGTLHLKFKDRKLWERFNIACAAGKLWLGMNTNGRDEFPGRRTYYRHGQEREFKTAPMPDDPMAMIFALREQYSGVAEPERQIADVPQEPVSVDLAALPSGAFTQDEPIDLLALAQASFFNDQEAL